MNVLRTIGAPKDLHATERGEYVPLMSRSPVESFLEKERITQNLSPLLEKSAGPIADKLYDEAMAAEARAQSELASMQKNLVAAAKAGSPEAHLKLRQGQSSSPSEERYQQAAKHGLRPMEDTTKAVAGVSKLSAAENAEHLRAAADRGHSQAMLRAAWAADSQGSSFECRRFLSAAAICGEPGAKLEIAKHMALSKTNRFLDRIDGGLKVPYERNTELARQFVAAVAKDPSPYWRFNAAHLMEHEFHDIKGAYELYQRLCGEGYTPAIRALASGYERGVGVKANDQEARRLYGVATSMEAVQRTNST